MTEVVHHRKTFKDRFFKASWRNFVSKDNSKPFNWIQLSKAIVYRIFRLIGELTAIVLGLACLWFAVLNSLMNRQSVDISGLKPNAQMWFSEAFNGSDAQIGNMNLRWLPATNNFVFEATDVVITDDEGVQIESIGRLETEIPMAAASKGILTPEHILIEGGTVTWLRNSNGDVVAGLGTPNTVGKLGSVWRGKAESQRSGPAIPTVGSIKIRNAPALSFR